MKEYYKDEKNKPLTGGGGGGGDGGANWGPGGTNWGPGGTNWGSTGDEKRPEPEFVDPKIIQRLSPQADTSALRSSAHGLLLADDNGELFCCNQLCGTVPAILVVIETADEYESHSSCIQLNLEYSKLNPLVLEPEKTLLYELWPVDRRMPRELLHEKSKTIHYSGYFPLPEPGEVLTIKASWQRGHHDINQLSQMNFWIFNIDCGTKSIGLNNWRTIATVTVDELYHITVNGLRGDLPGGKRNYHAN